jgi:uncharacterized protein (TIGR02246 family)
MTDTMNRSGRLASVLDEADLRSLIEGAGDAWAMGDADAFARYYAIDASLVLSNGYLRGRDGIRSYMADAFAGPLAGTRVAGEGLELRMITDDTAIGVSVTTILGAGETEAPESRKQRATWVFAREGADGWLVQSYQATPLPVTR